MTAGLRQVNKEMWPDETVQRLRELWPTALTRAEIGIILGVSKNAIAGKASRLDLPYKPSASPSNKKPKALRPEPRELSFAKRPPKPPEIKAPPAVKPGRLRECAWPLSDRKPWRFCCEPTEPGRPYCAAHCKRAKGQWQPSSAVRVAA